MQIKDIIKTKEKLGHNQKVDPELLAYVEDKNLILDSNKDVSSLYNFSAKVRAKCITNPRFMEFIRTIKTENYTAIKIFNTYFELNIFNEDITKDEFLLLKELSVYSSQFDMTEENNPVIAILNNKKINKVSYSGILLLFNKNEAVDAYCKWIKSLDENDNILLNRDLLNSLKLCSFKDFELYRQSTKEWVEGAYEMLNCGVKEIPEWYKQNYTLFSKIKTVIRSDGVLVSFCKDTVYMGKEVMEAFISNYDKSSTAVKTEAFRDKLTIACIIGGNKYSSIILDTKYGYNRKAMFSFIEYAVRYGKDRFLNLLFNSDMKVLPYIPEGSLMYNEYFYGKCIDLDKLNLEDFNFLCSILENSWDSWKELNTCFDVTEIKELLYQKGTLIRLANEIKKMGFSVTDLIKEIKELQIFTGITEDDEIKQLASVLGGKTFKTVYDKYFQKSGKDILYNTALKIFAKLPLNIIDSIKNEENANFLIHNSKLGSTTEEITSNFIKQDKILNCLEDFNLDLTEKEIYLLASENIFSKLLRFDKDKSSLRTLGEVVYEVLDGSWGDIHYSKLNDVLGQCITTQQKQVWIHNGRYTFKNIEIREKDTPFYLLENTPVMSSNYSRVAISTLFMGVVKVFEVTLNKTVAGSAVIYLSRFAEKYPKSGLVKDTEIILGIGGINFRQYMEVDKRSIYELILKAGYAKANKMGIKLYVDSEYSKQLPLDSLAESNVCLFNYNTDSEYTYNFAKNYTVPLNEQGKPVIERLAFPV